MIKKTLIFVLSLPILLAVVPMMFVCTATFLVMSPLFLLLDLIDVLKGKDSTIVELGVDFCTFPFQIWLETVKG